MNKQKEINNMLKKVSSNKEVYSSYGKILKISLFHILFILDMVIPSFKLLTLLGMRYKHIEIIRLTIKKD